MDYNEITGNPIDYLSLIKKELEKYDCIISADLSMAYAGHTSYCSGFALDVSTFKLHIINNILITYNLVPSKIRYNYSYASVYTKCFYYIRYEILEKSP